MVTSNFISGVLWGILGQVLSFIQLQASVRWGWTDKYSIPLLFLGLPISFAFMKSVQNFIIAFQGDIFPSRLNGFAVGIVVFSLMSWFLFKEGISPKTLVCLLLSLIIILIQVLWK